MAKIVDLLGASPTVSFEFFPPKTDEGFQSPYRTIEKLESRSPDFVSATWDAGGSTRRSFGSPLNP